MALSDHLRAHEAKLGRGLDPNNAADRREIKKALSTFGGSATDPSNNNERRAPCENCTQLYANLMSRYGAPKPKNIGVGALGRNAATCGNFSPSQNRGAVSWGSYEEAMAAYQASPFK